MFYAHWLTIISFQIILIVWDIFSFPEEFSTEKVLISMWYTIWDKIFYVISKLIDLSQKGTIPRMKESMILNYLIYNCSFLSNNKKSLKFVHTSMNLIYIYVYSIYSANIFKRKTQRWNSIYLFLVSSIIKM